ncbi:MAG: MAPEG family protein [Burkholderiales bacterium]
MSTFPIPITAIFAGLLALMLVAISVRVTVLRARKKIDLFDGGDPELGRALRVQGNFIEYVPMALALLGLAEWMGVPAWLAYALGIALVVGRVAHAGALYTSTFPGRAAGATITWIVLVAGALIVLVRAA